MICAAVCKHHHQVCERLRYRMVTRWFFFFFQSKASRFLWPPFCVQEVWLLFVRFENKKFIHAGLHDRVEEVPVYTRQLELFYVIRVIFVSAARIESNRRSNTTKQQKTKKKKRGKKNLKFLFLFWLLFPPTPIAPASARIESNRIVDPTRHKQKYNVKIISPALLPCVPGGVRGWIGSNGGRDVLLQVGTARVVLPRSGLSRDDRRGCYLAQRYGCLCVLRWYACCGR